jgi:hypothetical protein
MALFSSTVLYPPIATHDRLYSADIAFGVWASIILIALAMLWYSLGIAPIVDPTLCVGC